MAKKTENITEEKLIDLCSQALQTNQKNLQKYKEKLIDAKELELTLLRLLLYSVNILLDSDPNATIMGRDFSGDQNQILKSELFKLLKPKTSFDFQQVIKIELIDKALFSQNPISNKFVSFLANLLTKISKFFSNLASLINPEKK